MHTFHGDYISSLCEYDLYLGGITKVLLYFFLLLKFCSLFNEETFASFPVNVLLI